MHPFPRPSHDNLIQGKTGPWELVIGLEIHAQILSKTKLFSGAPVAFGESPNQNVSFVDAAFPGMLPVTNRYCIEQAIKACLALGGTIHSYSRFDRKNYFYGDLPSGYQISQFFFPLMTEGRVILPLEDGEKTIRILRLHLEQDAGKSMHAKDLDATLIDLNRAGTALMEIVSYPDISSPAEAVLYAKNVRSLLIFVGSSDGDMEKGNFRCDVNISLRRPGDILGTRTELKNINSFKFMQEAIIFETARHLAILEEGGKIFQETRRWDAQKKQTFSMRGKEEAQDYRYFPDPDLPPLCVPQGWIDSIRESLPELPFQKQERYQHLGLSAYDAAVILEEPEVASFFEASAALLQKGSAKSLANWIIGDIFAWIRKHTKTLDTVPLTPHNLAAFIDLAAQGIVKGPLAKVLLGYMLETGESPAILIEYHDLKSIQDPSILEEKSLAFINRHPKERDAFLKGKITLKGFFIGGVMREFAGKADPDALHDAIERALKSLEN